MESIDILAILHFYEKSKSRWRLISALIWDISEQWNRSDGRNFREKRIDTSRFLTPYIYTKVQRPHTRSAEWNFSDTTKLGNKPLRNRFPSSYRSDDNGPIACFFPKYSNVTGERSKKGPFIRDIIDIMTLLHTLFSKKFKRW